MVVPIIGEKKEEARPQLVARSIDNYNSVNKSINPLGLGNFNEEYKERQQEREISYPRQDAWEINDALGRATLGKHIDFESEKEPSHIIQVSGPAGYKKNGYLWTRNLDGSSGGAAPPGSPNILGPDGLTYLQTTPETPIGKESNKNFIENLFDELITGVKESVYLGLLEFPIILRDLATGKINSLGKYADLLSSLYLMGAFAGPIKTYENDIKCDRLEIIYNENFQILGVRSYNIREPTPFIKMLRKGHKDIIPRMGRPVESLNDVRMDELGVLTEYVGVGGARRGLKDIIYDPYYTESETLNWAAHKELSEGGLSTTDLESTIVHFVLSHFVYTNGSAEYKYLGVHQKTGQKIHRIILPPGYGLGLKQWDPQLFGKTLARVLGSYFIMHWPYYGAEKLTDYILPEKFRGRYKKLFGQREINGIFIPSEYVSEKL
jgi:hypothetical protein